MFPEAFLGRKLQIVLAHLVQIDFVEAGFRFIMVTWVDEHKLVIFSYLIALLEAICTFARS